MPEKTLHELLEILDRGLSGAKTSADKASRKIDFQKQAGAYWKLRGLIGQLTHIQQEISSIEYLAENPRQK